MKKILVQRCDRLGDTILAFPVLEALREHYPQAQIDLLTSPIGAEIAEHNRSVNNILIDNNHDSFTTLVKKIRSLKYDIYICLWNEPRYAWLGFLARIPIRCGDASNLSLRYLYNHRVQQNWHDLGTHQAEFNLKLLQPLFKITGIRIKKISASTEAEKVAFQHLQTFSEPDKPKVFIFCGSGGSNITIPAQTLLEFIKELLKEKRFNIIIAYGGQKNIEGLQKLTNPSLLNLIKPISLDLLIAYINKADFYIGPDTGPTHIASFAKIPMIFFQGTKHNMPTRWAPFSPIIAIIREEYRYSRLRPYDIKENDLDWFTKELLYQRFKQLMQKPDPKKRKQHILLNTFRVIYLVKSKEEDTAIKSQLEHLQKQGLIIFPFCLSKQKYFIDLIKLLKFILTHNINIIQGVKIPYITLLILKAIIGVLLQTIVPRFIKLSLNKQTIKLDELLSLYEDIYK